MYLAFIGQLIEALRDLLPSKEDSNKDWIIKNSFLLVAFLIIAGSALYALVSTSLGERYGIRLNEQLPRMTTMEQIMTRRQVWQSLSRLRVEDDNVRAVFMLVLIDKRTRDIVQTDNLDPSQTDILIDNFEIPVRRFSSIEIIEDILNQEQNNREPDIRKTGRCQTYQLGGEPQQILKRAIPDFISTHAALCPVYAFYKPRLVGATMIFFKPAPNLEAWHYEERLRTATQQVATFYRDMTLDYKIKAD